MKIQTMPEDYVLSTVGRKAKVNEFTPIIAELNDGRVHRITVGKGESASTILSQLREAAKGINRSTSLAMFDTAKAKTSKLAGVVTIDFRLVDRITRTRKTVG